MEFVVDKSKLLQALQHTHVVMQRGQGFSWCIWKNQYKMKVQDNTLSIAGTDGVMLVTENVTLEKTVDSETTFFVDNKLIKAIQSLGQQILTFVVDEYQITINHSQGYFRVPLTEASSFPEFEEVRGVCMDMEIPGLYSQLSKVAFATSTDAMRPVMNGILVEVEKDQMNFVATDGHILMCLKKRCQKPNENTFSFIMPHSVADTILRLLPKTGYCKLNYSDSKSIAKLEIEDNFVLEFKCIEGRFPNYRSVLPTIEIGFESIFSVKKIDFLKSVNRLLLFSDPAVQALKIELDKSSENNCLALKTKWADESIMAKERISCEFIEGTENLKESIAFKLSYLAKILKKIFAEKLVFYVSDATKACIIKFEPKSDKEELTGLIMPMALTDEYSFD